MPIYEFECRTCGHRFSEFFRTMHSAQEGPRPPCPQCSSADTQRVVSMFAVHGPAGVDPAEAAHKAAMEERQASITPKEQIEAWRSAKKERR